MPIDPGTFDVVVTARAPGVERALNLKLENPPAQFASASKLYSSAPDEVFLTSGQQKAVAPDPFSGLTYGFGLKRTTAGAVTVLESADGSFVGKIATPTSPIDEG